MRTVTTKFSLVVNLQLDFHGKSIFLFTRYIRKKTFLISYAMNILSTAYALCFLFTQRKDLLRKASQSIDLDVRIETFNVVCSNSKKTGKA